MIRKGVLAVVLVAALLTAALTATRDQAPAARTQRAPGSLASQLRYLSPQSDLVAAVDLRYSGPNGLRLRRLVSRGLAVYKRRHPKERGVPRNADQAVREVARDFKLRSRDIKRVFNGKLVVGLDVRADRRSATYGPDSEDSLDPGTTTVFVYRSRGGTLARFVKKLDGVGKRRIAGHPEARLLFDGVALVGRSTVVGVDAPRPNRALRAALDRGKRNGGVAPSVLANATARSGQSDPFVVAHGDLDLAGLLFSREGIARARKALPLLAATRGADASLTLGSRAIQGNVRVDTGATPLAASNLPIGPPGPVQLPDRGDVIGGGSRDQSVTTVFATNVARALFADSQFVRSVTATERKLGISFEQDFLRQFNCPSITVFSPGDRQKFAARSCVADPTRMRALLPRLAPELPGIVRGLQGLPEEGLLSLLLIAPDAPLTPSFGARTRGVGVRPIRARLGSQLYELRGLQRDSDLAVPDRVIFGMVGNVFVVGSDRAAIKRVVGQRTRPAARQSASITRVPIKVLAGGDRDVAAIGRRLFGTIELSGDSSAGGIDLRALVPVKGR